MPVQKALLVKYCCESIVSRGRKARPKPTHTSYRMAQEPTTWSQAAVPGPGIAGWLDVFRLECTAFPKPKGGKMFVRLSTAGSGDLNSDTTSKDSFETC
ncbi:hypothetical protein VSDG_03909 [Cytospora chrysosperma]|uniref:Uncharacterized protein n=1 Tax=Cytospora chrysosperma TaxID=252740 RepID=A0A423W7P4_CYTCH|nr:hypothetical protein VSDG_03909 [Valsa sordida]